MKTVKVFLREKPISKGRTSLYLDFYPPLKNPTTGKETRREFLGLYMLNRTKNEIEKINNKETKAIAESIRAKRQMEIQNNTYGFNTEHKRQTDFLQYFRKQAEKHYTSKGNYDNWQSSLKHLEKFVNSNLKVGDITTEFIENFKDYLMNESGLAINSQVAYFNKFAACIKKAFLDGLFPENPMNNTVSIKEEETHREFLLLEEIQQLAKTDCEIPVLKNAFLFSAFTGLRFSDVKALTWQNIQYDTQTGYFVRFEQQKTKGQETLKIPNSLIKIIGTQKEPEKPVFEGLEYSAWINTKLQNWINKAGINKKITFHCARHSFATLQLTLGTDIYTVSKMLGHKEVRTTQIYGKIIDLKKNEAMNKLNDFEL